MMTDLANLHLCSLDDDPAFAINLTNKETNSSLFKIHETSHHDGQATQTHLYGRHDLEWYVATVLDENGMAPVFLTDLVFA